MYIHMFSHNAKSPGLDRTPAWSGSGKGKKGSEHSPGTAEVSLALEQPFAISIVMPISEMWKQPPRGLAASGRSGIWIVVHCGVEAGP